MFECVSEKHVQFNVVKVESEWYSKLSSSGSLFLAHLSRRLTGELIVYP